MTPRVWMNKLNGQIVIAWPWEDIVLDIDGTIHVGWILEDERKGRTPVGLKAEEQFYDIGEW